MASSSCLCIACLQGAWLSQHYPSGKELLEHSGAVVRARLAPLLPGALLAPHLLALHTKLSYLVQPQGFVAGEHMKQAERAQVHVTCLYTACSILTALSGCLLV
jgi:hypothetical protein